MPKLISPDFLLYEAMLHEFYDKKFTEIPNLSYTLSDAARLGVYTRKEALGYDLRTNLGLAAKYILGIQLVPFQLVMLEQLWNKRFPLIVMNRGASKTFIMAVYSCLRALFTQGSKIVLIGASFRQSKLIFAEIERIYTNAPLFRQCCQKAPAHYPSEAVLRVGDSSITAVPLGYDGQTIRGLRATHIIADEFASIPQEVFQVVVRGFAAVSKDPAKKVFELAKEKYLKEKGVEISLASDDKNQIVVAGTAFYRFNHFYKTMEQYDSIITDKKIDTVENEFGSVERLDYHDYAVIQVPYTAIPPGFMDMTQIAQAKLTMHPIFFNMEYMAEFAGATGGFFPMIDIENATAGNVIKDEMGNAILVDGEIQKNEAFGLELKAQADGVYVMGADPARDHDNFAICIIKITKDGNYRVVYSEVWNRKEWGYSVRRIRELIKQFNIQRICIDKGGGGTTIEDLLKDKKYIEPGELPIFNIEKQEEEADWYKGLNILEVKDFSDYTWYRQANYSLQGDIHHRRIMFPSSFVDDATYSKYAFKDQEVDDCFDCIINTKLELAQIERTVKGGGREHFDLPEEQVKNARAKGIPERKDRYSALLLAAHAARTLHGLGKWEEKIEYIPGFWLFGETKSAE